MITAQVKSHVEIHVQWIIVKVAQNFSNFSVLDLYRLFSYVHCPLKVSLTGSACSLIINNKNKTNQKIKP